MCLCQHRSILRTRGWQHFLPNSHDCLQDTNVFLQCLLTGLLFSFSWQLNTNNSMDDVLGSIVCAQGGVQDMTSVINDHTLCLAWQRNCSTICMCSILLLSLGVIGTHGEACSFFCCGSIRNGAATPLIGTEKSYRRETRPGHCYSSNTVSWYHTSGLNGSSARSVHVSNPLNSNVKPSLLSCQTTLFDVDLQGCAHRGRYWHLSEEARTCSLTIKTVLITVLLISYNGDTCGIYSIV